MPVVSVLIDRLNIILCSLHSILKIRCIASRSFALGNYWVIVKNGRSRTNCDFYCQRQLLIQKSSNYLKLSGGAEVGEEIMS